jgi:hypothetical protein
VTAPRLLCSDGQLSARVDLVLVVPAFGATPQVEAERVVLGDPARLPRPAEAPPPSGPRRSDEMALRRRVPGLDLPDGLSAMQPQRVLLDPEDFQPSAYPVEKT